MKPLVRAWDRYWFSPADPLNLGVCRILFFGLMLASYIGEEFAAWADVPREFWKPQWIFETFGISVLPKPALLALEWVWKASLATACVGLLTRISTLVALAAGAYLLGLRHNFGKLNHDDAILVFTMAILFLSHAGRVLSLDNVLRRRRPGHTSPPGPSGEYRWPIRAVWLTLSIVFVASATAKLRRSGLEWAFSDNLRVLMVRHYFYNHPLTDLGVRLAQYPRLCHALAAATLAVELFFPLVLFSRVARWVLVPIAIVMQLGNRVLLGVGFGHFMIVYVFFVDARWLLETLRRRRTRGVEPAPRPSHAMEE